MADSVNTKVLYEDDKKYIVAFNNASDGTGENVRKVTGKKLRIKNIDYSVNGMSAILRVKNSNEQEDNVTMTYAASDSSGITVADNDNLDFGTGNYTIVWRGSLPDWTPSAEENIFKKNSGSGSNYYGYELNVEIDGTFRVYLYRNNTGTAFTSTSVNGINDGTEAEIVAVVTRETASTAGSVVFYKNGVQLGNSVTINAAAAVTISNTGTLYLLGNTALRYASTNKNILTFNRALSAAEVLSLYQNGIATSDKWGSQTAVYTSDFSAGVDGWQDIGGMTLTGNVDSINGSNDWLKAERTGAEGACYSYLTNANIANKKIKVQMTIFNPTGSGISYFRVDHGGTVSNVIAVPENTEVTAWFEEPAVNSQVYAFVFPCASNGGTITVATGSTYYLKNVNMYYAGATLALEQSGIGASDWQDSSTNNLDASYPATGWSLFYSGQRGLLGVGQ